MNKLADGVGAETSLENHPWHLYPFPGMESGRLWMVTGFKEQKRAQRATQLSDSRISLGCTQLGGYDLMDMAFRNVEKRNIEVMCSTAAKRLVQNNEGCVIGLSGEHQGKEIFIKAKKAVILACGGFEFNDWLLKQYLEIQPIYSDCWKGNTGDGILMAQKAGAALWHMWLLHGSYGFKFPEYDYSFRIPFSGALNPDQPAKVPWIVVNRYGKRFMNEAHPFLQDSGYRPMEAMNCDYRSTASGVPEFTNIPPYMIFDEEGRKTRSIAKPRAVLEEDMYYWSEGNIAEIEKGWIKRADSLTELAGQLGMDAAGLERTIDSWNNQCAESKDTDFSRIPGSMMPIENPPYYGVTCWPIITNTQGGPQFNVKCQVVDPYGDPIPKLYKAGELGSFFGHLYLLSGNLSECVIEGRTAGENAAAEPCW
jgi:succinate dehydrogenase/fumarate reductase flavoprotein subunit